jgi:hypothetical protein
MAKRAISFKRLNDNLSISEYPPDSECETNNWWVYDKRAGRNIGFRAETKEAALIESIEYWSKRAIIAETCYADIKSSVELFVARFSEATEEEEED